MTGLVSLSRAMFLGFVRDRSSLFFTILFPLMFLVLFGGLFADQGVARSKVVEVGAVPVLDQVTADGGTQLSRILTIRHSDDLAGALGSVRQGDFAAAVEQQGDTVVVHYSAADGVRANTVRTVLQSLVEQQNLAASGRPPRFTLRAEQVEDRSLKAIQYFTPALLGWAIATGAMFGAAITLVSWRNKHILRRLRLAPVGTWSIVAARVAVALVVALGQTAIFLGVGLLPYFGLQLSHYWWMAIPVVVVGTLAFLSIGLVAGAWAKTEEAANGIVQLVLLPMAFLSGSFFPLDDAPPWLRTVSEALPLRHLNRAMLDVMVRGRGPASVLPELAILAGFAVVLFALASRLFRWDDV